MKTMTSLLALILSLLFGCSSGGLLEDPAVEILKKSSCGIGNATIEDYCNQVVGVNGQVKWIGMKASSISDENWKDKINPYKNNPDISLVFVEMKKMTKKGSEKKATLGYAVNTKTRVFELFQFEVDGKPQSILLGLIELGIMSME
jgi:hypothetical protein